jgi:oligosaccharide repeat unit polymerase
MWLLIIHGYLIEFEGYLAAKPGFYSLDIKVLSAMTIGLWLIGYLAFIGGATVGNRFTFRSPLQEFRNYNLLKTVCMLLVVVAALNFSANVILISGGNLVQYLSTFALRPYDVEDNKGVTAVGYLLGFIGVQVMAFIVGRKAPSKSLMLGLLATIFIMLIIRFSQGRVFQTLVLLGTCYVSHAMGAARRTGRPTPWIGHIHYLMIAAAMGVSIYFLRLSSSLSSLGVKITWDVVTDFGSRFAHFALERGNVPNFPIVFTIIDKMPSEVNFFYGKTLFNWAVFFIPRSILPPDYLISYRIKNTWYLDVEGGGLPPTAIGEWYANFGVAGVIFGMFVVGLAMGVFYKAARVSESPYLTVLWANLVFGFVVIYPKTDLAQIPVYSIFVLLCLWLLMVVLQASTGRIGARTIHFSSSNKVRRT